MKCPTCESCEYAQYCGATEIMRKCERHNKKVEQTNEEWFCSLPTEEKAKVLYNFFMARTFCHICPENNVCDIGYKCKYGNGEVEDFIKWLKQPHTKN